MIKIGLLGCGFIAQNAHLPALQKADGLQLTAICDQSIDLLRRVAEIYQVQAIYDDHRRFLEQAEMQAVLVAVPDPAHLTLVSDCLRSGKHVLVEKPLSMTVEESRQLVDLVEATGLKLQVGFMKRFDPGLQFAHQFVAQEMGERLSINGWYCDSAVRPQMQKSFLHPPLYSTLLPSGPDPKADLKAYKLRTHGAHLIDLLRYLGGDIRGLQAKLASKNGSFSWNVLLEFVDGASGHMELTIATQMDWFEGFHIHGQNGSVVGHIAWPFYRQPAQVQVFDARRKEYRAPQAPDSDAYERQLEAFAAAISRDSPVSPDVYDGLACQKIVRSIERSVESGEWVRIE